MLEPMKIWEVIDGHGLSHKFWVQCPKHPECRMTFEWEDEISLRPDYTAIGVAAQQAIDENCAGCIAERMGTSGDTQSIGEFVETAAKHAAKEEPKDMPKINKDVCWP